MPASLDIKSLINDVVKVLKQCYDPEIPVNVYDLGLIYEINADEFGDVDIKMTLTSPACPVAGSLPREIESRVATVSSVKNVRVEVIWDPPWEPRLMSEEAKLELGFM